MLKKDSSASDMLSPLNNQKCIFKNANVITMESEKVLYHQDVVIEEQKVTSITPSGQHSESGKALVIDAEDKFLFPGLCDMHVHVWNENHLKLLIANGVTTVRNMWGSPLHLKWRNLIEKENFLSPNLYTTNPLTDGHPPVWNGSNVVTTEDEALETVKNAKESGYDAIKVYNKLTKNAYRNLLNAAKTENIPIVGHIPYQVGLELAIESGQIGIEHLQGYLVSIQSDNSPARSINLWEMELGERMATLANNLDLNKIEEVVALTKEYEVWNCPTQVVIQKIFASNSELKEIYATEEMDYIDPPTKASWNPSTDFRLQSLTEETRNQIREMNKVRSRLIGDLHKAGAKLVIGTDTPNPFVIPGFSIHEEIQNFSKAGLSNYDVLRCCTVAAAEYMGDLDIFGTISLGKRADLILLNNNPLEDLVSLKNPVGVMLRGTYIDSENLKCILEEIKNQNLTHAPWFEHLEDISEMYTNTKTFEIYWNEVLTSAYRIGSIKNVDGEIYHEQRSSFNGENTENIKWSYDSSNRLKMLELSLTSSSGSTQITVELDEEESKISGVLGTGQEVNEIIRSNSGIFYASPVGILSESMKIAGFIDNDKLDIEISEILIFPDFKVISSKLQVSSLGGNEKGKIYDVSKDNIVSSVNYQFQLDSNSNIIDFRTQGKFGISKYNPI